MDKTNLREGRPNVPYFDDQIDAVTRGLPDNYYLATGDAAGQMFTKTYECTADTPLDISGFIIGGADSGGVAKGFNATDTDGITTILERYTFNSAQDNAHTGSAIVLPFQQSIINAKTIAGGNGDSFNYTNTRTIIPNYTGFVYVLEISGAPSFCGIVTSLAVDDITANNGHVTWDAVTGAVNYYTTSNTTGITPSFSFAGDHTHGLTEIETNDLGYTPNPNTLYYIYVRSLCADGSLSSWVGISFTTAAAILFRTVTTNHTLTSGITTGNRPLLVRLIENDLRTIANGGKVANINGYDIIFSDASDFSTLLSWEIERYIPTTGELLVWVKIPSVSGTVNVEYYMQYGDISITTFQGGATGAAFNSEFRSVLHLPDGVTLSAADSTINARNGTILGPVSAMGIIDGGAEFTGSGDHLELPNSVCSSNRIMSFSMWIKTTASTISNIIVVSDNPVTTYFGLFMNADGTVSAVMLKDGGLTTITVTSTQIINNGDWHYIVATYNGTSLSRIDLKVDGNVVNITDAETYTIPNENVWVGSSIIGGIADFVGVIDDLRFADQTLFQTATNVVQYNTVINSGDFTTSGMLIYGPELPY